MIHPVKNQNRFDTDDSDGTETDLTSMIQIESKPILTDDPDEIDTNLLPYDSDGTDICGDELN